MAKKKRRAANFCHPVAARVQDIYIYNSYVVKIGLDELLNSASMWKHGLLLLILNGLPVAGK
jgi:hypothetical protein